MGLRESWRALRQDLQIVVGPRSVRQEREAQHQKATDARVEEALREISVERECHLYELAISLRQTYEPAFTNPFTKYLSINSLHEDLDRGANYGSVILADAAGLLTYVKDPQKRLAIRENVLRAQLAFWEMTLEQEGVSIEAVAVGARRKAQVNAELEVLRGPQEHG